MGAVNLFSKDSFGKPEQELTIKETLSQLDVTKFGAITWLVSTTYPTTVGAIASIFDRNITTYFQWIGYNEANYIKWDFKRKMPLKSIIMYFEVYRDAETGTCTVYLEGSNDNVNWTEIAQKNNPSTITPYNIGGTYVKYRYYRIRKYTTRSDNHIKVYDIMMTI